MLVALINISQVELGFEVHIRRHLFLEESSHLKFNFFLDGFSDPNPNPAAKITPIQLIKTPKS